MTTEPLINLDRREGLASIIGALASMISPIAIVAWFIFGEIFYPPENPENDGYVRGFATLLGFIPLMLAVNFVYYIFMSIKKNLTLKSACKVSVILSIISGMAFSWIMRESTQIVYLLIMGCSISLFFAISLCVGSWAWHCTLKKT